MINEQPSLTFAVTLKRWFKSNAWPQRITEDWAKDSGVKHPHGPWASQLCGAMKAAGYNPKAEFFLALADFNQFVANQDLTKIANSKLRDRLKGASPLTHDDGRLFSASDLWSVYAGLIQPPSALASSSDFNDEDAAEWTRIQRDNFRELALQNMCTRAEAWGMVKDKMLEIFDRIDEFFSPEDLDWAQEVLAGLHDPTAEELTRITKRYQHDPPLTLAMAELLGDQKSGKSKSIA